jgi:RecB family exonuclease
MSEAFSASRIGTYQTCPRLYYYQYVDRQEQPKHILTLMGSALHKAIEAFYKQGAQPLPVFSKEFYGSLRQLDAATGLRGKESPGEVFMIGKSILEKIDWSFKPLEIELGFNLPFPNKEHQVCDIRGFIDMIAEDGTLVDHKSGKTKPTKKKLSDNVQFLIYMWAYRQLYGQFPSKMYWHHLRTGELVEVTIDKYEERLVTLTALIETIKSDTVFEKVEQNGFCRNVCNFYEKCWGIQENVEADC